jgi:hypothetical protein
MILDCLLQITSLKRRGDILSNAFSHRRLKLLGCRAFIDQPSFDFSTGIQTEWDTFVRMENHRVFHSHCPHCKSEHSWRPEDAKIVTAVHRNEIIALAAKHRLPAVYPYSCFVRGGGLISCGPDTIDQYRRAADYVDRIFKGEKPADLPVQKPTKYNLAINLKTAQSLGLAVPHAMLTRADEVIE